MKSSYMPRHCGGSARTLPNVVREALGRIDAVGILKRKSELLSARYWSSQSRTGHEVEMSAEEDVATE